MGILNLIPLSLTVSTEQHQIKQRVIAETSERQSLPRGSALQSC